MKSIPTMMDMTWEEVDRLVKENALVLMAVGIIEEHGPHLPISTDLDLAMAQAEDVRQELECNILECARRSVPEFKDILSVVIFVKLYQRNRVLAPLLFCVSLSCIVEKLFFRKVCQEL